jgi:cation diffusion facilitator family transporter
LKNNRASLTRFAWLSIAAAIATIALKSIAYWLTGSVGLLSDAIESVVNLLGASIALVMLTISARPPDEDHVYGHGKAEYFSSGAEGVLILVAAVSIGYTAVNRLIHPRPLEQAGMGLAVSAFASLINLVVSRILLRAGKKNNSITLEADARHLMTDVWTSVGVIGGIGAVAVTGWKPLDPIVALAVAANIVWTGFRLVQRSVMGLMDTSLPEEELKILDSILERYRTEGIRFHALKTRQAAAHRFASVHVLVPDFWTVRRGHRLMEQIESEFREALPDIHVTTHMEPVKDSGSSKDVE